MVGILGFIVLLGLILNGFAVEIASKNIDKLYSKIYFAALLGLVILCVCVSGSAMSGQSFQVVVNAIALMAFLAAVILVTIPMALVVIIKSKQNNDLTDWEESVVHPIKKFDGFWECPKCGKTNDDSSSTCSQCGDVIIRRF